MNRLRFTVLQILLIIIPAYTFADGSPTGFDMNKYGVWASYGFFIIIFLFIIYFLYSSSKEREEHPDTKSEIPVFTGTINEIQASAVLAPLKLVNYSVISIIFLYVIIFVLLII